MAATALVAALAVPALAWQRSAPTDATPAPASAAPSRPALPVLFEPTDSPGGYRARGSGLALALRPTEAAFVVGAAGGDTPPARASLRLVGADPGAALVPSGPQRARSNYFLGNDPKTWRTEVPTYARVVAKGAYPGVDVAWYGAGRGGAGLEYDVVVAPGADPAQVALAIDGAERLELDGDGALVATLAGGHTLRQHAPLAYQPDGAGGRTPVEAAFRLEASTVRFALAPYDRTRQLVIDPVLAWSTYLGGGSVDSSNGVGVDTAGNVYVTGHTYSGDFPTTDGTQHHGGVQDLFVTKFDPSGNLQYSTLVGGGYREVGMSVVVSPAGYVHVVGYAASPDFPTVNPQDSCPPVISSSNYDAVAVKLSPAGNTLVYSTCLGGPKLDIGRGSALDAAGNLYLAGQTQSKKFPVRNNAAMGTGGTCLAHAGDPAVVEGDDAFLTKLGPKGAIKYSTCWGGVGPEQAWDVDGAGNAYVVGTTYSPSFPQKNNAGVQTGLSSSDGTGFVLKVSPVPSPKFSTFVGGNDITELKSVMVEDGLVYLAGGTFATDLSARWPSAAAAAYQPAYAGGDGDGFLARLRFEPGAPHAPVMDRLTYLGGNGRDAVFGAALGAGGVWAVLDNQSSDFPEVGALQACHVGNGVVARLDPDLTTLEFSTCLGGSGSGSDFDEEIRGVAADGAGNAYVTGFTYLADHPTTEGAYDRTCGTDSACTTSTQSDAYVARYSDG